MLTAERADPSNPPVGVPISGPPPLYLKDSQIRIIIMACYLTHFACCWLHALLCPEPDAELDGGLAGEERSGWKMPTVVMTCFLMFWAMDATLIGLQHLRPPAAVAALWRIKSDGPRWQTTRSLCLGVFVGAHPEALLPCWNIPPPEGIRLGHRPITSIIRQLMRRSKLRAFPIEPRPLL